MKNIGNVKVISAEERTSKAGNKYYRCVGMSDENLPTVFFAGKDDAPKVGAVYHQLLTYDNALVAKVIYQRAE